MLDFLRRSKTIRDLNPMIQINKDLMETTRILIVDDNDFSYLPMLRSSGYNVHQNKDVEDIHVAEGYHIIISDVDGVAQKMDPKDQGMAFIRQVGRAYPEKITGVYSGKTFKIQEGLDNIMVFQKDDDLEVWKDKIDELILRARNPINVWRKIAATLINKDIPASEIAEIESDYVYRVLKNKSFDGFPKKRFKIDDSLIKLITNIATRAIAGQ